MLFNYIFDNDLVFYNLFSTTAGYIGYSLITSYLDYFYVDKIFKLILEMNIQIDLVKYYKLVMYQ